MLRRLRTTLGESPSPLSPPLSKYRWLRVLAYLFVAWLALFMTLAGGSGISDDYRLSVALGLVAGLAQGVAVVLALWRPVPAWTLSLSAAVLTALTARANLDPLPTPPLVPGPVPDMRSSPNWPWTTAEMVAHTAVFLLLALRLPARRAIVALLVSGLATYGLEGLVGAQRYTPTGLAAVAFFSVAVLLGSALRGRREARTQLIEQTTITAEERARRTLLEERNRIARELHDVVAHHMSVISIQAQVAPHFVENPSEELRENLDGIRNNALEALTELRRVLGVLRSENPADPYGIGSGTGTGTAPDSPQPTLGRLDTLVENTRAAGMEVLTEITGDVRPLSPGVELSAYRIIQEALSNALRHAPGSTVRVELAYFPRGLQLRVINSRPTRPAPPSPGAGHGLLGMRERAVMLGGTLFATETHCGGFAVACFLPSPQALPAADDTTGPTGEENR